MGAGCLLSPRVSPRLKLGRQACRQVPLPAQSSHQHVILSQQACGIWSQQPPGNHCRSQRGDDLTSLGDMVTDIAGTEPGGTAYPLPLCALGRDSPVFLLPVCLGGQGVLSPVCHLGYLLHITCAKACAVDPRPPWLGSCLQVFIWTVKQSQAPFLI